MAAAEGQRAAGWSLRGRLLALIVAVSCGVISLGAAFIYYETRISSQQIYDDSLRETGELLLQLVHHEIEEHGLSLGAELIRAETETGDFEFRFQVWTEDMRSAYRTAGAPATPYLPLSASGYGWTTINGQPWRAYAAWNPPHTLQLQIAESLDYRQTLPRRIFWRLAAALAILLPASAALLWLIIANGFHSVRASAQAVAERAPDDLRALDAHQLPQELAPLLESFNRLLSRMREVLAFERRFTADAAHELRTPLAAIRANTQVMQGARSPDEFSTASADLLASVDRSGRLIEQLLSLARVDASASLPKGPGVVDLAELIETQIAEQERFAARRNVELDADVAPALIRGERELLTVLLRNLADNAIRYSQPGARVVFGCRTHADHVELTVDDEGVGIEADERERIFERFYRIRSEHDYGSGLGLSIVRRIADLHHASVEVGAGLRQRGTRFTVRFPLA